ncbi:hypothetical protein BG418_08285 [Streptomyces sp. CBMA152]|nr:hypothetical protein [Streptomyces sp. CBMA152]
MATEARASLNRIRTRDPSVALLVGEAVVALLDEGPRLGPPMVVEVESVLREQNIGMLLDDSYQRLLHLLQQARRAIADIATSRRRVELQTTQLEQQAAKLDEQVTKALAMGRADLAAEGRIRAAAVRDQLEEISGTIDALRNLEDRSSTLAQRLQGRVDVFRMRKETGKAVVLAARAHATVDEVLADAGEPALAPEVPGKAAEEALAEAESAQAALLASGSALEQEARGWLGITGLQDIAPPRLLELRLGAVTGHDTRLVYVVDPPGAVIVLAIGDEQGDWWGWYHGVLPDARYLASARPATGHGQPGPGLVDHDRESFLQTYFPDTADEVVLGAAQLAHRNRTRPLQDVRRLAGVTRVQLAARMGIEPEQVAAFESAEPGTTDMRMLVAYVQALGGRLEVIADLGAERIVLDC